MLVREGGQTPSATFDRIVRLLVDRGLLDVLAPDGRRSAPRGSLFV